MTSLFRQPPAVLALDGGQQPEQGHTDGRLSISQLAIEADVKRWHLTHQHLDLKGLFQARVKTQDSTPEAFSRKLSEHEQLKKKYADLRQHCADLEERLQVYATAIDLLTMENAPLSGRDAGAYVLPIRRPRAEGVGVNERSQPDRAGAG
ncbi:hypothetical protein [Streptomyces violascens]|uniref:Uncharacterized protein n=1 Tax=Streptomyces violascens TaxID=67381 RepID=A0ABQ3QSU5_9ACTN|nr:hypothetical protein [Streptomyces violascens]GGU50205.1 hypothetical protein GCM10010289_83340 [Streptomyces violascens]GHI40362.1 hypothetical protein Sviol_47700 [Streptomyces violascens]